MKKIIVLTLMLLVSSYNYSQVLDDLKKTSHYTYIFKLSEKEANLLYTKGIEQLKDTFFHTLVDSFLTEEKYEESLQNGYYLKAYTNKNKLKFSLSTVKGFDVKIINNSTDLIIQIVGKEGNVIQNANVYLKGKKVKFDKKILAFKKRKSNKKGLLKVEYKGLVSYYQLSRQYNNSKLKRIYRKVVWATPLKYPMYPINYAIHLPIDGVKSIYKKRFVGYAYRTRYFYRFLGYRINNFINNLDDRFDLGNRYETFIVFNKPKYRPNDTVKFKTFIVNKRAKPLKKDVIFKLYNNSYKAVVNKKISPYRKGGFADEFVLHDSLNLQLDKCYSFIIEKHEPWYYDYFDFLDTEYLRASIKYEDYELHQNKLRLKTNTKNQYKNNDLEIRIKGTDENGLNLQDARYELYAKTIGKEKCFNNYVFVPNTLYKKEGKLEPTGETKIIIPDSIFPKANLTYKITVNMLTSDNERKSKHKTINYFYSKKEIKHSIKNDSINIWFNENNIRKNVSANLYFIDNLKNKIKLNISELSAKVKIHPNYSHLVISTNDIKKNINIYNESSQLKCYTKINKDSLFIKVVNPAKLKFSYFLYKHNKEILRGYSDSLVYKIKHPSKKEYLFSIQYLWGGKMKTANYGISRKNNKGKLYVKLTKPDLIFPGQKTKIGIEVKDCNGKPVNNVDITAMGITKKFNYNPPHVPNLAKKKKRKYKEHINSFRFNKIKKEATKKLNYKQWNKIAGLDSMEYYKFLYPKKGVYKTTYNAKDSITQFSPYVLKDGAFQKVYIVFVDGNPVYFSWMTNNNPYSFKIDSGYHRIKIRVHDAVLLADSIYFKQGVKTIFSIDKTYKNKKDRKVWNVGNKISYYNKRVLAKHIFPYRYNFGNSFKSWREQNDIFAYIEQEGNFIMLNPKKHTNTYLAGPINAYRIYFTLIDGHKLDFAFEPNFEFDILPKILKMRTKTNKQIFPEYLNNRNAINKTTDFVIDKKEFYMLYEKHIFNKRYKNTRYYNPKITTAENGTLEIDYIPNNKINKLFANIILFRRNDDDFVRIYQGSKATFHNLKEGLYKIAFIYADSSYHIADSVKVKKNGYNYCKINEPDSLQKDEFSNFANALIRDNIFYDNKDAKDYEKYRIKKRYNKIHKYFDRGNIIDGFVTDNSGQPIPGVTVLIKGTKVASMTNLEGYYSMSVPYDAEKIIFSYIGFKDVEKDIDPNYENNAILYGASDIEEVVVTALGISRSAKAIGYSVTTVNAESMLSGKVAGVSIVSANNIPMINTVKTINNKLKDNGNKYDESFFNNITKVSGLRTNFSDYAFWQPKLRTNKEGKAEFEVKFPDDITNWDIHTFAINGKRQTGQAKGNIKSYKPLSARLYLPRFILEGDYANAIGKSLNYLSNLANITSEFNLNDSLIFEKDTVCKTSVIDTLLLCSNNADTLKVKYLLKAQNGYFDGEERKIPVLPVGLEKAVGSFNVLDTDTSLNLLFNKNMGDVNIYAKSDALGVLEDEIGTLIHYVHNCNEQMSSKLKAMLFDKQICEFKAKKFKYNKEVKKLIKLLSENQNEKGLWGWWGKTNDSQIWISTHVLEALLKAEKMGYKTKINKEKIINSLEFQLENREYYWNNIIPTLKLLKYLDAKINYAYFIKKIDELEKKNYTNKPVNLDLIEIKQICGLPVKIEFLKKRRHENFYGNVYYSYPKNYNLNDNVYYSYPKNYNLNDNVHQNNNQLTLKAYNILRNDSLTNKKELLKIRNYFFEQRKTGTWRNTYESAKIIETILPDLLKKGKTFKKQQLIISGAINDTITKFPYKAKIKANDSITISKTGSLPIYFTTYQRYWDKNPKRKENNFIVKSYFNTKDKSQNLKAGKKVKLIVQLTVLEDAEYVMLDISIPAACSYSSKRNYYKNEVHREYHKHKTNIYCRKLNKGYYTFEIDLLPRYTGTYTLNPAKAELMYFPTFYANTGIKKLLVE